MSKFAKLDVELKGKSACGCSVCGKVFKSENPFALHRKNGRCLDPATLGMSQNQNGFWRIPNPRFEVEA